MTEIPSDRDRAAQDAEPDGAEPDLIDKVSEIVPGAWNEEEHVPGDDEDSDDPTDGPAGT